MYLRESKQKRADGSVLTHLQLAESVWDPERNQPRVKILYNCGRADDPAATERLRKLAKNILRRCSPEEIITEHPDWQVVDAWPHGALYVLEQLWARLGIPQVLTEVLASRQFDFDVERALFAMVANRCLAPSSKLYCYERWLADDVRLEGAEQLALQHLYRAMDVLAEHKDALERALYFRLADLLSLDVELVFYDTTSLHFEIDEEDALRRRGHAKNGRSDAPQIVVGLAVTRDGFPVRHWIFPGHTVDVTTVAKVKEDLKGWQLSRCVFVGDAGMVSKANLATLAKSGGKYIVCMPVHPGGEVATDVLTRQGRYQRVADNLEVKEVTVGDGERRRRYVVCYNPEEAKRQHAHRARVLEELEAELATLADHDGPGHAKRVCQLRASGRYGRYVRLTKTGQPRIDRARVTALESLDGKFVVHSNDDTLSAADLALGYKQLARVEAAWRQLKSGLKLRPVYHHASHRIAAHVALTVLGLLLERVAEAACGAPWRDIRDDLERVKLAQLSSPHGTVWQVTEPPPAAAKHLKNLKIPKPPPILRVA